MSNRQPTLDFDLITASAVVGCVIGILDFVLFELTGNAAGVREYLLYKPSLFGVSFFSSQLLVFSALGVLILVCLIVISRSIPVLNRTIKSTGTLAITVAIIGVGVLVLRIYKTPESTSRIAMFIVCCSLLSAWLLLWPGSGLIDVPGTRSKSHAFGNRSLIILAALLLASFAAPDAYSLALRTSRTDRGIEPDRPNILLIVMDTVRADHLSCYGYGRLTSPNIDRVAAEGLLFTRAFAAAPWTLPSHASLFTGLYPSQHGATWRHQYLDDVHSTIAERLLDDGYRTVGFSENPFVGFSYGLTQGFTEFHETWRRPLVVRALQRFATRALRLRARLEYSRRSTRLLQRWLANHRADRRPFFAFVNLMTAHHPRYPRPDQSHQRFRREDLRGIEPVNLVPERFYLPQYRLGERELSIMKSVYDSEIGYLDEQIGAIIRYVENHGLRDNTIIILTSDHGENFGDHGFIEHQFCVYNSLISIPLVILIPPPRFVGTFQENFSLTSLPEIILRLVEEPPNTADDLHRILTEDLADEQSVVSEFTNAVKMLENVIGRVAPDFDYRPFDRDLKCVISGNDKLIWSSNGEYELYSLEDDFGESNNLVPSRPERVQALAAQLESWAQQQPSRASTGVAPEVDSGTSDALRALGYEQ